MQIRVLVLAQQTLYPLSHPPIPQFIFNYMDLKHHFKWLEGNTEK